MTNAARSYPGVHVFVVQIEKDAYVGAVPFARLPVTGKILRRQWTNCLRTSSPLSNGRNRKKKRVLAEEPRNGIENCF